MKPTQGYKEQVFLTQQGEEISWGLLIILAGVWGTQHQNFRGRTSSEQYLLLCSLAQGCALLSPNLLLPALDSAPRRCTSHRPMGQLIKVGTLILSFVLLWDYNFPHLKVERYAKNSDPINKGERTSQGTAVVQCEHWARNLLGGKPQKTSLYREMHYKDSTAAQSGWSPAGWHWRGSKWCFNNPFSSTATGMWHVLMRTTFPCNSPEREITTLQIMLF